MQWREWYRNATPQDKEALTKIMQRIREEMVPVGNQVPPDQLTRGIALCLLCLLEDR
jgi:hypothetical protein